MGLFCVNFHFRTSDDKALSAAVERRGVARFRVLNGKNGWTSLYEERASEQDDVRIRELGGGLSQDLNVAAIAFLVHDSDIACYWLFENGQLLDEYNSCPDYFDVGGAGNAAGEPTGGQPDILLRYCRPGVGRSEIEAILSHDSVFAERVIKQLADALGVDPGRAITDYRDIVEGGGGDGESDEDDEGVGPSTLRFHDTASRLLAMLGGEPKGAIEPQVNALVNAAARDDTDEVDRLLAAGVAIDAEAPSPLPLSGFAKAGVAQLFPGGPPKVAMTALLAAVTNRRRRSAERLLAGGADPNRTHPVFGTAVHAAVAAGDTELLQLIIGRGGDVNALNAQGQTALDVIAQSRRELQSLARLQAMIALLGVEFPQGPEPELSAGWDACERILKAHQAR